jgi:DUF971 family protein
MATRYPVNLRVVDDARRLEINWDDQSVSSLEVRTLREQCRCTECRRIEVSVAPEIVLRNVLPYGTNAVQLVFSDGHERGIFPFAYLAELAAMTESG